MLTLIQRLGVACLALLLSAGLAHAVVIDLRNSDGSTTPLKSNGAGAAMESLYDQLGGEHVGENETEELGYMRTVGGKARSYALMTDVTTDTSSATTTLPSGGKTFFGKIVGSAGAQSVTVTIYGDYKSTATEEFLICTLTLSGTSEDAKKCTGIGEDYDYYHAKTASISGTDATVNVWAMVGLGGSGGSGSGGEVTNAGTFAVQQTNLLSGEDETNDLIQTSGGATRMTQILGTGGVPSTATDATSATSTLPVGMKTFQGVVTCTGTCVQTQKIYGTYANAATVAASILVCTLTNNASTTATDWCKTDANYNYWFVVTSATSGTTPLAGIFVQY